MTTREKIESILAQPNYKVEDGKIFHLDLFDEWKEKNHSFQIQLKHASGQTEMFAWSDVESVIRGDAELIEMAKEGLRSVGYSEKVLESVAVIVPAGKIKKKNKEKTAEELWNESNPKTDTSPTGLFRHYSPIRKKEIAKIRKMVEEKKSINAIAKELGAKRTTISYIVKQIREGKILKYEN